MGWEPPAPAAPAVLAAPAAPERAQSLKCYQLLQRLQWGGQQWWSGELLRPLLQQRRQGAQSFPMGHHP